MLAEMINVLSEKLFRLPDARIQHQDIRDVA